VLVHAPWNTTQILCVSFDRRDDHRATVSFDLHAGLFLANAPTTVLQLGTLLETTPFNIHFGPELVSGGSISIGCQLHIHPGDTDLVAKRTRQLVQLASFHLYLSAWPGDIETRSEVFQLLGDDD
jgi:hypothetical protein